MTLLLTCSFLAIFQSLLVTHFLLIPSRHKLSAIDFTVGFKTPTFATKDEGLLENEHPIAEDYHVVAANQPGFKNPLFLDGHKVLPFGIVYFVGGSYAPYVVFNLVPFLAQCSIIH